MKAVKIRYRTGTRGLTYLRVSSKGQVETEFDAEGMSLPAQRRKCEERARAKRLVIADELVDPGISATSIDKRKRYRARPAFIQRMICDCTLVLAMQSR